MIFGTTTLLHGTNLRTNTPNQNPERARPQHLPASPALRVLLCRSRYAYNVCKICYAHCKTGARRPSAVQNWKASSRGRALTPENGPDDDEGNPNAPRRAEITM